MQNDTEIVNLGKQCGLCLEALEAILPVTEKAGILSSQNDAYDEWETLVKAVFEAFVVLPICDTTGKYSPDQFHQMGFDPEKGKLVVSMILNSVPVFVSDLVKDEHGKMHFEVQSLSNLSDIHTDYASSQEGKNYSISTL